MRSTAYSRRRAPVAALKIVRVLPASGPYRLILVLR
jgi:hypothetical protein